MKNSKGWIISGCPSHRDSTDANCIRVRDANLYPIEDAKILTAFEVAEAERDDSRQIAQNLLDEKCKALAERDQVLAELEAGLKLMHEHMRQRDEIKTKLAAQSAMVTKLADYLETATGIIEEGAAGDEDDIADARGLISEARALVAP